MAIIRHGSAFVGFGGSQSIKLDGSGLIWIASDDGFDHYRQHCKLGYANVNRWF
jgi:hypothetical protein